MRAKYLVFRATGGITHDDPFASYDRDFFERLLGTRLKLFERSRHIKSLRFANIVEGHYIFIEAVDKVTIPGEIKDLEFIFVNPIKFQHMRNTMRYTITTV